MAFSTQTVVAFTGFNRVTMRRNPTAYFQIWRQYAGEDPELIAPILAPDAPSLSVVFDDYNTPYGKIATYWGVSLDGSDVVQEVSNTHTGTQSFGGAYLHKLLKEPNATSNISGSLMHLVNQEGASRDINVPTKILHLPALDKPIIEMGTTVGKAWRIPIKLLDLTDGTREILINWIKTHSVLNCRDDRGRQMFGMMRGVKENLDLTGDYPFELHQCDYREAFTW